MASVPANVLRFRRDLLDPVNPPIWPVGVHLADFTLSDAAEVHALMSLGYADGGGAVGDYSSWWESLSSDGEFDPALCFIARCSSGSLVGVAQCWTSAFVKDLVVHPGWRRIGLGEALLRQVFATFRRRGATAADLKVRVDNPSGAVRLYKRVGMHVI
jgi:ribosomal protein S18 acetylase RimI-like enzyme